MIMQSVESAFPGYCACCGEHYGPPEQITMTDEGWTLLRHANRGKICPKCSMEKSVSGNCPNECEE